jgi:hypothetical protein
MTPTSLITRSALDGVAVAYETNVLPVQRAISVLWKCLQAAGCEALASEVEDVVEADSVLHRWIVLDAIQSAESVPQGVEGTAAIAALRAWVTDPSDGNRVAVASTNDAVAEAYTTYASYADVDDVSAYNAVAYAAFAVLDNSAYAASNAAYYAARIADASVSAQLRFRVLATMAQAGVLPNPVEG